MYPILFDAEATSWESFGVGVLSGAISCEVEENRNGSYELEMKYPISGAYYREIGLRSLIVAKPNHGDGPQPFRVYKISKPIGGVVTINAQHISYDLSGYVAAPFKAAGIRDAMAKITSAGTVYPSPCTFSLSTDIDDDKTTESRYPQSIRSILGKGDGNLLETYGGEWHFDGYRCELKAERGEDRGVAIRYGKNMIDLKQEENNAEVCTAVYPYYFSGEDNVLITLPEKVMQVGAAQGYSRVLPVDLTSYFDGTPTAEDLRTVARSYIEVNNVGVPKVNLTIKFVNQETEQDRVDLCDTVQVQFDKLGVSAYAKCIRAKWDTLKERYIEAELGTPKDNLAATIVTISKATKDLETIRTDLNATAGEIRTELATTDTNIRQEIASTAQQITNDYTTLNTETGEELRGVITQTAEQLTSDYTALNTQTGEELRGTITQTAESLTSDYTALNSQTGQELRGVITQTAESLTSDYTALNSQTGQELRGVITQTAESLTSDYTNKLDETESHITQTASEIKAEVKNNKEELQSAIDVQAGRIGLVVEGTGSNAKIKPAQIVAAINDGASSIKLSADHITLDGKAVASSLSSQDINCASITAESLRAFYAGNGNLLINEIEDYLLDRQTGILDGVVYDASVSGNTLTLKRYGNADVTFSKAATLSVAYGGDNQGDTATYTVTGTPAENFGGEGKNSVTGEFTVHQSKTAAYILDKNGSMRARIDNPQYGNGWAAAQGDVSWPGTNTSSAIATFKAPSGTVDGTQVTKSYYLDIVSSGYSSTTKVYLRNPDDQAVAALDVGKVYDAGKTAGAGSVKMALNTNTSKIVLSETGTATEYAVSAQAGITYNSSTHKYTPSASALVGGTVMASNTGSASGTEAYDAGWKAAHDKFSSETSYSTDDKLEVNYPPTTVDGSALTREYYLTLDDDYAYIRNGSRTGTVVARVTNTKKSGSDITGLSSSWDGNTFKVSTSTSGTLQSADCTVTIYPTSDRTLDYGETLTVSARGNNVARQSIKITAPADRYAAGYDWGAQVGSWLDYSGSPNIQSQGQLAYGYNIYLYYVTSDSQKHYRARWEVPPDRWDSALSTVALVSDQAVSGNAAVLGYDVPLRLAATNSAGKIIYWGEWRTPPDNSGSGGGGSVSISIDDIYATNYPPTGTTATQISRLIRQGGYDFITFRVNAGGTTKRYNIEL
ncbi:MAG: phage tail protein [Clostridia bacterium]|nr:phage tail protein [Clostridia bacterium]